MFKIIILLLLFTSPAVTADIINETNIFTGEDFTVGGTDYIVPHNHYWDSWFSLHNNGDTDCAGDYHNIDSYLCQDSTTRSDCQYINGGSFGLFIILIFAYIGIQIIKMVKRLF